MSDTYLDQLCEADQHSQAWREAVAYGRRIINRMETDRWRVGDLLCLVFPYEDYDQTDPHARIRAGGGERRVIAFGRDIGLTPQQSTRYWKTAGVWTEDDRVDGVSWSTYNEAVTEAARPVMRHLLERHRIGGPTPTVDRIRAARGKVLAGAEGRSDLTGAGVPRQAHSPSVDLRAALHRVEAIGVANQDRSRIAAAALRAADAIRELEEAIAEEEARRG